MSSIHDILYIIKKSVMCFIISIIFPLFNISNAVGFVWKRVFSPQTMFMLLGILYKGDGENTFISQQPHVIKSIMGKFILPIYSSENNFMEFLEQCAAARAVFLMASAMQRPLVVKWG